MGTLYRRTHSHKSFQRTRDYPLYPRAHFLGIPQETRDEIYTEVVKRIQGVRHTFEGNPVSSYDGLYLSCKQLHDEAQDSIFCFRYTSQQLTRIPNLKLTRTNFKSVRSVGIEIPFGSSPQIFRGIATFLDRFQLSLQELHLFFIGNDRQGNHTSIHGCGKKQQFDSPHGVPLLLDDGRDFGPLWELLRQTAILRNLRVLQIENANLPLTAPLLYNNKPYLRALSVNSDPRSTPCSLARMKPSQVMQLYRKIGIKVKKFPPLKVLSLSANSAPDAEGIVSAVSQTLEHLSWRVPNPDFQPYRETKDFFEMSDRIFQTLRWRAPRLERLRLCVSMRERESICATRRREFDILTNELSQKLHEFPALKHLEIHFRGDQGLFGFFKQHMVARLPPSLSRLYLSDDTISVTELVSQARRRYFTYFEDDESQATRLLAPTPTYIYCPADDEEQVTWPIPFTKKLRWTFLAEPETSYIGDKRYRQDDIPLRGGNLGFVNFEYSRKVTEDDEPETPDEYRGSDRTKILRLNGLLLDREHNQHLAVTQEDKAPYGITSPEDPNCDQPHAEDERYETSTSSEHPGIYNAIYDTELEAPKEQIVKMRRQDLEECLVRYRKGLPNGGLAFPDWEWYFGTEKDAQETFRKEVVAKVEDQRQKPTVAEVEVVESDRCRWACPDYDVPPVGSFTAPKVPADWKDHV